MMVKTCSGGFKPWKGHCMSWNVGVSKFGVGRFEWTIRVYNTCRGFDYKLNLLFDFVFWHGTRAN